MGGAWSSSYDPNGTVDLRFFKLGRSIGRGAFGKVKVVVHRQSKQLYALKYINKDICIKKKAYRNIFRERNLLESIQHPFIINLRYSFQDDENMFMVLDLMLGGDLRFHLNRLGQFSERVCVFYAAELSSALMYLHSKRIIHRDIKPENLLLSAEGHCHITDFNCATVMDSGRVLTSQTGTTGYMAPEVYSGKGYNEACDWWSLGIVLFECLHGERPFVASSVDRLILKMRTQSISFSEQSSRRIRLLLEGFLQRDPQHRLGICGDGHGALRSHPAFSRINWDLLDLKQIEPPFVPEHGLLHFEARYELEELLLEENPLHGRPKNRKTNSDLPREKRLMLSEFKNFDFTKGRPGDVLVGVTNGIFANADRGYDSETEVAQVRKQRTRRDLAVETDGPPGGFIKALGPPTAPLFTDENMWGRPPSPVPTILLSTQASGLEPSKFSPFVA
ncbi:kinase-like domain-containing protein [Catenaria anguillulae PL171]|uniref:Kinase-like domain-containing protein n=1 Tax=Catenaria anguillulae PL171 TaxID=765915 RepID=A0A1Y2I0Y2_9FUNG|nr:kinase-like domain-containing protein [Catenaria anguillulae PL171]